MTSENVAAKYGVSRDTQDKFAAQSHAKMAAAQKAGKFDAEIIPVATVLKVQNILALFVTQRDLSGGLLGDCELRSLKQHVKQHKCTLVGIPCKIEALRSGSLMQRSVASCAVQDPKTGEEKKVTIRADDGVRPGTTAAGLAKLRAVFKKDGSTTAGNSSQVPLRSYHMQWCI